mmetsp:Transcript_36057/g.114942  ORF Transcript_36057/g.114942 Transcript_36057/m.114942 type:complete len:323 (+) Transcript_36057:712-1680(+)|eukprot:scaffold27636_cov107-Isochrysis_galbana.AAC.5
MSVDRGRRRHVRMPTAARCSCGTVRSALRCRAASSSASPVAHSAAKGAGGPALALLPLDRRWGPLDSSEPRRGRPAPVEEAEAPAAAGSKADGALGEALAPSVAAPAASLPARPALAAAGVSTCIGSVGSVGSAGAGAEPPPAAPSRTASAVSHIDASDAPACGASIPVTSAFTRWPSLPAPAPPAPLPPGPPAPGPYPAAPASPVASWPVASPSSDSGSSSLLSGSTAAAGSRFSRRIVSRHSATSGASPPPPATACRPAAPPPVSSCGGGISSSSDSASGRPFLRSKSSTSSSCRCLVGSHVSCAWARDCHLTNSQRCRP